MVKVKVKYYVEALSSKTTSLAFNLSIIGGSDLKKKVSLVWHAKSFVEYHIIVLEPRIMVVEHCVWLILLFAKPI